MRGEGLEGLGFEVERCDEGGVLDADVVVAELRQELLHKIFKVER